MPPGAAGPGDGPDQAFGPPRPVKTWKEKSLAFEIDTLKYSGRINETRLGRQKITLGGQSAFPFYNFEGTAPNKPRLALQILDLDPGETLSPPLAEAYRGVTGDPGAWARKAAEYGADMIFLSLKSSDPNDRNRLQYRIEGSGGGRKKGFGGGGYSGHCVRG
jgi:CO dehydrogenase/acetyl-CoA synthase delta subunit